VDCVCTRICGMRDDGVDEISKELEVKAEPNNSQNIFLLR
jgi:hypothetical protein